MRPSFTSLVSRPSFTSLVSAESRESTLFQLLEDAKPPGFALRSRLRRGDSPARFTRAMAWRRRSRIGDQSTNLFYPISIGTNMLRNARNCHATSSMKRKKLAHLAKMVNSQGTLESRCPTKAAARFAISQRIHLRSRRERAGCGELRIGLPCLLG